MFPVLSNSFLKHSLHNGSYSCCSPSITLLSPATLLCLTYTSAPHFTQMACTFCISSAMAHRAGIGPKGTPL